MFTRHMQHGMPPSDKAVCDKFLGDITDFHNSKKRQIDFGEVVILDTADACKIQEAYETGQYEGVLRVLSGKCTFASVKHLLLPMNVVMQKEGMVIAQTDNGNHFVLGELLLAPDNVVIYDWFEGKSPAYYKDITDATLPLLGHTEAQTPTTSSKSCSVTPLVTPPCILLLVDTRQSSSVTFSMSTT
jgi:hypothetical protein